MTERKKLINNLTGSRPGLESFEPEVQTIDQDVSQVNALHKSIITNISNAVKSGIMIGEILSRKKNELAHGQFIPWIENNFPFKRTTAWNYMRMFENRDFLNVQRVEHLRDALKLIGNTEKESEQELKRKPTDIYKDFLRGESLQKNEKLILREWMDERISETETKLKELNSHRKKL